MIDLSHLNPEQRRAVETTEGPLLVLAGAGSGKTGVVVHRIAYLMEQGARPDEILAVTFTNKAAAEMRERVVRLVGKRRAEGLTVSTFHAFGLTMLREHLHRLGWPKQFSIYDTQDQNALIKRILGSLHTGPQSYDLGRLLSHISLAKNAGVSPEIFERAANLEDPYELVLSELYPRYQRALKAQGAVDFDDLILLPLALLEGNKEVQAAMHARFRYLMVDEYQDTSKVQVRLLKALAGNGNVCVVGDDDQSIYAWRGAEPENILRFERAFAGAQEVKLTRNYRSTGFILNAANAVIAGNTERRGKELWTEVGDGAPIDLVVCDQDADEAEWVAVHIDELCFKQGGPRRSLNDIAILYRLNGQASAFEDALNTHRIAYKMVGGMRLFDRKEVRDALAYLRVALRPEDEVSLRRIINTPSRGIGDATLERLSEVARQSQQTLWQTLKRAGELPELGRSAAAVTEFVETIERHRSHLRGKQLAESADSFFEETGVYEAARNSVKSVEGGASKVANVRSLVSSLSRFAEREKNPQLSIYMNRIALDGRDEGDADKEDEGKVTMLTLHAAKGLEFPVVFLVGMEEGLLPHEGMGGLPPNLPEERRLAYVGITRARENLILSRCKLRSRRGRLQERVPSRFLEDLPKGSFVLHDRTEEADEAPPAEDYGQGSDFFAKMRSRLSPSGTEP